MNGATNEPSVALVVGVTGMAGVSLAAALKRPTAPGAPWKVYGAARRPMPSWLDPSTVDRYIQFDALDSDDAREKISPLSDRVTHVFWVALQSLASEEANIAANTTMLANVVDALTSAAPDRRRLRHVALQTGTKHYMWPIWDPVFAGRLAAHDTPFREEYPRLPFPCFYYAQEDLLASHSAEFTWSVHRSSVILGASSTSIYNTMLTLAVYASICRRERLPLRFPGTEYAWEHFCDASDAGLLAEQQIWAATTEAARNQAFNCTNGDVYTWKGFWKVLSEIFEVESVPPVSDVDVDWVGYMKGKGAVWDAIVEENGLCKTKLEEITSFEAVDMVLNFKFQHVSSMNKSREFGFHGFVDTLKSVKFWVDRLRDMNIIPK